MGNIASVYPKARHHGRDAVTLIETAALIAIAAVLLFCLVPALAGVSRYGASAECLANLGRIGHANTIYNVTDPSDPALPIHHLQYFQMPNDPTFIGAYEWGGKSGKGRNDFVPKYAGTILGSKYGTAAGFGPASRPLNRILFARDFEEHYDWDKRQLNDEKGAIGDTELDLSPLRCPADSGYTGVHFESFAKDGYTSYDHFGTSYTTNMFMIGSVGGGQMYSNSPYLHRTSKLLAPSSTLAFLENNGRFAWSAQPMPDACLFISTGIPGVARGWHGEDWVFNASYIDAHAEGIYMRSFYNPQIYLGEDASYDAYQCIIVRGDTWQMDTFPAPLLPTGLSGPSSGRPSWEDDLHGE